MPLFHNAVPYLEAARVADAKNFRVNHWLEVLDFPAHLHAQTEMIYVQKGAMEVLIDDQTRVLRRGDFAIAFPNRIHAYRPADEDPRDVDIWFFIFRCRMAGEYADGLRTQVPETPFVEAAQLPEEARVALSRLALQQEHYRPAVVKAYLQIVADSVWPLIRPKQDDEEKRDLSHRALSYMIEHFRQPITMEGMAKDLCVSRNHLSAVFTKKLHMSFRQCLNTLRIEQARDLLRNTERPVTDILYECGYESTSTFNRAFVELCGVTPREYRSQLQRMELATDLLRNTDRPVTNILRECGYDSADTFMQVFWDLYGVTPEEYRAQSR